MNKRNIDNLVCEEKRIFHANVEIYKRILDCAEVQENGGVCERTDCGQGASNIGMQVNVETHVDAEVELDIYGKLLELILSNQQAIMAKQNCMQETLQDFDKRLEKLETMHTDINIQRCENLAQNVMVRECKVLIKRMHKSLCRITGEAEDDTSVEITSTLPISTIDALVEVEEKLQKPEYEMSMKTHIFKLKGSSGTLNDVLSCLLTDEFCFNYNFDGNMGKQPLIEMHLINNTLFDVFQNEGRQAFNQGLRRFVDLSHNRHRQRQNRVTKQPKPTSNLIFFILY